MPRVLSTTVLKKKKEKPAVSKINSWKPTKEVEKSLLVDSDGKISAVDFATVPAELMSSFNLIFYQSAEDAVFKALGVD